MSSRKVSLVSCHVSHGLKLAKGSTQVHGSTELRAEGERDCARHVQGTSQPAWPGAGGGSGGRVVHGEVREVSRRGGRFPRALEANVRTWVFSP